MDELKPCPLDEARKILWYCAQFTDNTHWKNQYRRALTAICDELDRRPAPKSNLLTCAGCKNFEEDNISDTCAECARFVHPDYYARKPEGSEKALATKTK